MNRRFSPLIPAYIACALLASGCATIRTKDATGKGMHGLPVRPTKEVHKHNTVIDEYTLKVTLLREETLVGTKDGETLRVKLPKRSYAREVKKGQGLCLEKLKQMILEEYPDDIVIDYLRGVLDVDTNTRDTDPGTNAWQAANCTASGPFTKTVANTVKREVVADYDPSKLFYINGLQLPLGSSSFSAKIAADGTLRESTAAVDSGEGLASFVPIKEFLTAKLLPTPSLSSGEDEPVDPLAHTDMLALWDPPEDPEKKRRWEEAMRVYRERQRQPKPEIVLKLEIAKLGTRTTLTRETDTYPCESGAPPDCPLAVLAEGGHGVSFTREALGGKSEKKGDSKGKKVSVSGTVVLPEDKEEKKE